MITIKAAFTDRDTTLGLLGRVGENGTRQIEFDCSEILAEYPAAVIVCAVKRPGEASAYYADMQAEGALRRLILRDVETEKPGTLKLELSALDGEKQRRTTLYAGAIASGLTRTDEEPSDPEKDLIDYIADAETVKQEASNAAKDALAAAGRATDAASEIENMTANAVTLAPGEPATANYNAGVLTIGVPKGDKGDPGEPGSDAAVTKQNIEAALGYAPVKDVQVAGSSVLDGNMAKVPMADVGVFGALKFGTTQDTGFWINNGIPYLSYATDAEISGRTGRRKTIVCANLDYAVKAAMCDGKGAVWTDAEQKAARERMGIDKAYELIEEITTDGTAIIERTQELDGTPYNFKSIFIEITSALENVVGYNLYLTCGNGKSTPVWIDEIAGNTNIYMKVAYVEALTIGGLWHVSYRLHTTNNYIASVQEKIVSNFAGNITKIHIPIVITAGVKFAIYGVRAQ